MRVLMVNYEFPPVGGGAGRVTWHLCQNLAERQVKVEAIVSIGDYRGNFFLGDAEISSLKINRLSVHHAGIRGMVEFLIQAFFEIRRRMKSRRYDIVHYFFSVPTGLLALVMHRPILYVVSLQGGDVPGYNPGELQVMHGLLAPLNRWIWRKAGMVTVVSDDLGKVASKTLPCLPYRIIYNGVDINLFYPPTKAELDTQSQNGQLELLTVGRLVEWKGIQYLLEALALLSSMQWRLSVAGTGYFEAELHKQAKRLKIQDQVRFLGYLNHDDLPSLYRDSDMFVLPSYGDSFGMVFTEAMACGLPIIAAKSGGVQEFVKDGINGFLVPPKDVPALASAIEHLGKDKTLRRKMGENNIKTVKERFSWDAIADQYLSVYKEILR